MFETEFETRCLEIWDYVSLWEWDFGENQLGPKE